MKKQSLAKLILASLGLMSANTLMSAEANAVKTTKSFNGFKVELVAPSSVDAQQLLSAIPEGLTYSEDTAAKVSTAVDKVRVKTYPDETISLDVIRLGEKVTSKTTSGYVSLYKANYWWNRVVAYNGRVYGYNYYRNTVTCFARTQYGSWYGQYQVNGTWYNQGYVYAGGVQAMYATGSDNNKGCNWWGKSSSNKGDFVIYVFD